MDSTNTTKTTTGTENKEEEFEWDDSDVTLTAWSKARKNRAANAGRRIYGSRARSRGYGKSGSGSGSGSGHRNSFSNIVNHAKQKQMKMQSSTFGNNKAMDGYGYGYGYGYGSSSSSLSPSLDFNIGTADAAIIDTDTAHANGAIASVVDDGGGDDANENTHPNISSSLFTTTSTSTTTMAFSSSIGGNANNFSSLSKSANLNSYGNVNGNGSTYGKTHHANFNGNVNNYHHNSNDVGGVGVGGGQVMATSSAPTSTLGSASALASSGNIYCTTTPSRSTSTSSSRKRGVCDSPAIYLQDDYYDDYYNYNNCSNESIGGSSSSKNNNNDPMSAASMMNGGAAGASGSSATITGGKRSTSSYGSRRARSRIFSPDSTKKLMDMEEARAMMMHTNATMGTAGAIYDGLVLGGIGVGVGGGNGNGRLPLSAATGIAGTSRIRRKNEESFQESDDDDDDDDDQEDGNEELNMSVLLSTSCETHEDAVESLRHAVPTGLHSRFGTHDDDDDGMIIMREGGGNRDTGPGPLRLAQFIPNRLRRMSSVGSGTFEQAIFQPVEDLNLNNKHHEHRKEIRDLDTRNKTTNANTQQHPLPRDGHIGDDRDDDDDDMKITKTQHDDDDAHSPIFATMSSYEDLKFVIKELRRWNDGKKMTASFGFNKNCTVVPPNKWKHERKVQFIEWTTCHLGFCQRSGGGKLVYLQTTVAKGQQVLSDLEAALLSYKESCKRGQHQKAGSPPGQKRGQNQMPSANTPQLELLERSMKNPPSSIKILRRDIATPLLPSARPNIFRSSLQRSYTPMSIEKPPPVCDVLGDLSGKLHSMNIANEQDDQHNIVHADVMTINNSINVSTEERAQEDSFNGATPLARMVTLSNEDANRATGRLSSEHSVLDASDFVSHMHGISPFLNSNKKSSSRSNVHRPPVPLSFTGKKDASMGMGVNTSLGSNHYAISPAFQCIPNATLSFDCAETPMPKENPRVWGSRPIAGKDWGVSEHCEDKIIQFLTKNLQARKAELQSHTIPLPLTVSDPIPCVPPEISAVRADSTLLGFEYEVESCSSRLQSSNGETYGMLEEMESNFENELDSSTFSNLDLNDSICNIKKDKIRREKSIAKRNRMSICEAAMASPGPFRLSSINSRTSFAFGDFNRRPTLDRLQTLKESIRPLSPSIEKITELPQIEVESTIEVFASHSILLNIFSYLTEYDLMCSASLVSSHWADVVTDAHASLMLISVGCSAAFSHDDSIMADDLDDTSSFQDSQNITIAKAMERSWDQLVGNYPWGMFLSEGSFKRVYKVWNALVGAEEAVSVMDVNLIDNVNVVGSELAVSVMLSSLARRNICPNFVLVRGVFTSVFEPPVELWGSAENRKPLGSHYKICPENQFEAPPEPSTAECGSFQFIRMELCRHGDVEEYIKRQPNSVIPPSDARCLFFQMAFSLHVAGNKFAMKHYDVKLLNFFMSDTNDASVNESEHPFTVMQYGLGSHIFNLRMRTSSALTVKLADFGTANVRAESNCQPVTIGNFTTLENTPPDFLILGDAAEQGYGHDYFGLGLCMLHLFTGCAPYEEILEEVRCPLNLKKKLKNIWENKRSTGYEVIRSVILDGVYEDDQGNIIEGEPDATLYDTLYRFLVLFGIPEEKFQGKEGGRVWRAIDSCLYVETSDFGTRRSRRNVHSSTAREGPDASQFKEDCRKYSIRHGNNEHIARAREILTKMDGGMNLLLSLVSFDPRRRASPLDVVNSKFMEPLREKPGDSDISDTDIVHSYMSFSLSN